jgi:hypothetical protein
MARQLTLCGPDYLEERIATGTAAPSLASASGDEVSLFSRYRHCCHRGDVPGLRDGGD